MQKNIYIGVIIIVVIIILIAVGAYTFLGKKEVSPEPSGLISFSIEGGNMVILAKKVARVEIWVVPTGTSISESDYTKLGDASLASDVDDVERWVLPIPKQTFLAVEL